MMVENKHKFSDEWLVKALLDYQIIDKDFVDESRIRYSENEYFIDVLLENNHLSPEDIAAFVENVLQIPYIDLNGAEVDPLAVEAIPEKICREYQIFPFRQSEKQIEVAFANPFNLEAEKEIAYLTGKYVKSYFGLKDQIKAKTEEYYSPDSFIDNLVDRANIEKTVIISGGRKIEENTPVVKLVSLILGDAIDKDASDIHIEPKEKLVIIRYRIDGILRNVLEVPKSLQASLTSRIKILANMNIAETRKPQDGGAKVVQDGTDIDLRISILPTNFGEKVVIRILDKRKAKLSFEQLGIQGENLDLLEKCFAKTQGIILVTGPTGSGKTTTLYAALNRIRNNTNNIITIEDPIEYKIEGINQVQVNEKAGVTFSSALRSFLRQDPDVMLVGEIRDRETAEIAIQASLTGHLVLSTLHTNDALVAITRLIDMGIDPYKIASSLEAIIAQRLVRVLCPHCRNEIKPGKSEKKLIPYLNNANLAPRFYESAGCQKCNYTGYSGRIGVFEILLLNDEINDLISRKASIFEIRRAARKVGYHTLFEDGLKYVADGTTDYKELIRIISPDKMDWESGVEKIPVCSNFQEHMQEADGNTAIDDSEEIISNTSDLKTGQPSETSGQESLRLDDQPPKILVVDDSESVRKMMKMIIKRSTNWKFIEAENAQKGLELVIREKPSLILLDVMMPQIDGYKFLQYLRKNLATATIPVIMVTALNKPENEVKGFSLGADDYVSKPFNPEVLLARMKYLLARKSRRFEDEAPQEDSSKKDLRLI